jgi:hypothetical protein
MAGSPSATPAPTAWSGRGCLALALLLPVVIVGGIVIGTMASRPDAPARELSVTIDSGTIGGVAWRVDAVRDVDGDHCAFLFQDGEQLTGGCALTPDDATFGDQTVVFGRAATNAATVRVELSTGEVVEIDTVEADGLDGRYYASVVDGDVDAKRLAVAP